jgi:hypothetical protein
MDLVAQIGRSPEAEPSKMPYITTYMLITPLATIFLFWDVTWPHVDRHPVNTCNLL